MGQGRVEGMGPGTPDGPGLYRFTVVIRSKLLPDERVHVTECGH